MPETLIALFVLAAGYIPLMLTVAVVMFALWLICYKIRPSWGANIDAFYEMLMGNPDNEEFTDYELYGFDDTRPIRRVY